MECADADTLGALVSDALSEGERAKLADHAASCDRCHAVIEALFDTHAWAGGALGSGDAEHDDILDLDRGTHVGRYVVEERLGAGGMGVVHAAVDSELQRRVALKLLRPDRHGRFGAGSRERLLREARTLARLSHPNVVTVFDVGAHRGHLFIAMELVDGGSLTAWLERSPRTADEIIDRLREAGCGLAAAHAAGVVHRDVKPDNILVGLDGRARMTDFGLAQLGDLPPVLGEAAELVVFEAPLTRTGTLMGTPVYMAPEQLTGSETDPRTDQWSFCATLYEALAGVRPFSVDDLVARSSAIDEGRLAAPLPGRTVPGWVRQIVVRGLRSDPDARWPSMDAVVHALARGRQRRRHLGIAIAGVAIAGLAIGATLLARGEPPASEPAAAKFGHWVDPRPGCSCPYSACNNGCVSVCRATDYTRGAPVPGINVPGHQEALLGISGNGDTILYLTGRRCAIDRLMLARRRGATFEPVDLTDKLDLTRVGVFEGCCTLSPDGETLVLATAARTGFVRARVVGSAVLASDAVELANLIPSPVGGRTVGSPVLSADGLTLYYRLNDPAVEPGDVGPLDGSYASVRADLRSAFPVGRRMTGAARKYEYITGVSSDGLSLFMTSEFETHVLVRSSTAEPFGDPGWTLNAARLEGWRAMPLADCTRILTTLTPGGCEGEDIAYLEPVP